MRNGKSICIHAKVCARGGLNAICATSEVHRVEIHLQDFVFAVLSFDLKSQIDFFQFAPKGFLAAQMCQFGKLLRDGTCTLCQRTTFQIAAQRTQNAIDVDSVVRIEAQIFCGDKGKLRMPGDTVKRHNGSVFCTADLAEQFTVSVIDC